MICVRCNKRDSSPGYDLCRACRYYTRGDADPMLQVSCRVPASLLDELTSEAKRRGESLAFVMRSRLARSALGES